MKTNTPTPDAKGDLRKGLMTACIALGLLDRMDSLQKSVAAEEAREQDGSTAPSRFMEVLKAMSDVVKQYVSEEVAEMLSGDSDQYDVGMPYSDYVGYADKATDMLKSLGWDGATIAAAMEEIIGDRTAAPGYTNLEKFATTELVKLKKSAPAGESADWPGSGMPSGGDVGANNDWKQKAQGLHDLSIQMGADCELHKGGKKCAACGAMNKSGAEKCMKCEKAFGANDDTKKSAKADATKSKKDDTKDNEEDDQDGGDDEGDEGEDGDKNPDKPGDKKKKAAGSKDKGIDPAALPALINDAIAASPLAKAVETLTGLLSAKVTNPPKPAPVKAVTKSADAPADDNTDKTQKAQTPQDVLRAIHGKPNYYRNE